MNIDEKLCPLCGGNNACSAHDNTPCWCFSTNIPQDLLALVPTETRMKACICQKCVERFYQAHQLSPE